MVSWKSKKQSVVTRSSVESEYRAMAHTNGELIWLKSMLKELSVEHPQPMELVRVITRQPCILHLIQSFAREQTI